jgi:surface antigen
LNLSRHSSIYFKNKENFMKTSIISMLMIAVVALGGCQATGGTGLNKQTAGAALGGILGGLGGSQIGQGRGRDVAMVVGALAGAAIGGMIGSNMDETDRMQAQGVLEQTPDRQPVVWQNPNTHAQYEVIPTRTVQTSRGACREYTTKAVINGKKETVYGYACRQPDGTWQEEKK